MYECRVEAGFSAVHQVRMYDGALESVNGHDWRVEAVFRGAVLDRIGVVVDFVAAERALKQVVAQLHHTHLNEVAVLGGVNPTAENIARFIFDQLRAMLDQQAPLVGVYVHEAPGCVAGYFE
jgi:6-pyruvoyltetrahydropterin/6-carboxytetrahydropterin synthase